MKKIFNKIKGIIVFVLFNLSWTTPLFGVVFNGTYYVGAGQTYTTIQSVITDLNAGSVSGPVVFLLTDAVYSYANNVAPLGTINSISGASATNTITFKPAPGVYPVITITANATQKWGFNLNGADYIIFDGSNTSGGTTRDMTIVIAGREGFGFYLKSGASYNTIKNCKIKGYSSSTTNKNDNKGIYFTNDANNDNNSLINNEIYKFYDGIWLEGNNTTRHTNNLIRKNKIGSITSSEYIFRGGIVCTYQNNCTLLRNEVFNIISTDATSGIELDWSTNGSIQRNLIHDLVNTSASANLLAGIFSDITNIANPNITISNNMIYHIAGYGNNTHWSSIHGIFMSNQTGSPTTSSGVNVYFNSIYLTADATYGLGANNCMVDGVNFNNYITGINFKNNIIRVSLGERAAVTGTKGYAVVASYCGNAFAAIDYNMYYVSGQDNNNVGYKVTSGCVASDVALAAWQTYTGSESNTTFGTAPDFVSTTDLHINSTFVDGTDIAGITEDFDGDSRGTPAKKGADDGCTSLNGTYLVGEGRDYPDFETIQEVIAKLKRCGISGPVEFSLTDPFYSIVNSANPEGTNITPVSGASSTNTITFKPYTGIFPKITITANATQKWGFKLNGADYFIFDGSNTSGGTSKDMTITTAGANSYVFYMLGSSNYNTIKNCNIVGYSNVSTNYGIYAADFSNNDEYNTITNNYITKAYVGIYMQGIASPLAAGNTISNNTIGYSSGYSDASNTNHIICKGIELSRQSNLTVYKNEVRNIINTSTVSVEGIHVRQSSGVSIAKNNVHDIINTNNAVGYYAKGIYFQPDIANPNTIINNNFVYNIAASGNNGTTLSTAVSGIHIQNVSATATTTGVNILFNSVYMGLSNNTAPVGYDYGLYMSANNTHISTALAIENNASGAIRCSGIDCRNNIFRNSLGKRSSGTTGGSQNYYIFAIAADHANNPFATIDNNNYDVTGTSTSNIKFRLGYVNGTEKTFVQWQAFTTQDANSITTTPNFISSTDLHLSADCNRGTSVTGIIDDIDDEERLTPSPSSSPDIGADEFEAWLLPVNLIDFEVTAAIRSVELTWTTASEVNNDYFSILRSADGVYFEQIGIVQAKGNSNFIQHYVFQDEKPYNGISYYRLKQVDYNGLASLSEIRSVFIGSEVSDTKELLTVYPNPSNNVLNFLFHDLEEGSGIVKIVDLCGRCVYETAYVNNGGINQGCIDVSSLPRGNYILQVFCSNGLNLQKKILLN